MNVLCKKTLTYFSKNDYPNFNPIKYEAFKEGNLYECEISKDINLICPIKVYINKGMYIGFRMIINDEEHFYNFTEYFYTIKELRSMKIKKLQKK